MTGEGGRPGAVRPCELPTNALLRRYREAGAYADCYVTDVPGVISQARYVEAFYTTALFSIERAILRWLVARPSTDSEARRLAEGNINAFAAWQVEERSADQLLLRDVTGRTRSWLMVESVNGSGTPARTRLYFGSAIVQQTRSGTGRRRMGFPFNVLGGFHRLYSRLLLGAARSRVMAVQDAGAR